MSLYQKSIIFSSFGGWRGAYRMKLVSSTCEQINNINANANQWKLFGYIS